MTIRISPNAIQRQELLAKPLSALALARSAGARVCTDIEADGRGRLVLSAGRCGRAVGLSVGRAVAAAGLVVGDAVIEVRAGGGVSLPAVAKGVGERDAVAGIVAVVTPIVGSSVGVGDGAELVGIGVSEGTPGDSVGAWVGGGAVGLPAVGVLVGVAVGMVWFRWTA